MAHYLVLNLQESVDSLFLNSKQTLSKSAPPIGSMSLRVWCFCLFSELCWLFAGCLLAFCLLYTHGAEPHHPLQLADKLLGCGL